MSYGAGYAAGLLTAEADAKERIADLERQLAEAHEEVDALVRTKVGLTEMIEELEKDWQPTMSEEWRPVLGYEGKYDVSSRGIIRRAGGGPIGQYRNDQGYMLARLSRPRREVRVHRVVAEAFIENPSHLPCVNHIDCNRANNYVQNLEWCTQKTNLDHSRELGRMQEDYWLGKRSPSATLSDSQVRKIREEYSNGGWSYARLGRHYGISKRSVDRIVNGIYYRDVV